MESAESGTTRADASVKGASSETVPGETVSWRGQPRPWGYVRRLLLPTTPIGAAILIFGLIWESAALRGGHSWLYVVGGVGAIVLGAYGLGVRPLLLWRAARRTIYAVDEAGVHVRWGNGGDEVTLFAPEAVPPFRVQERRGGVDVLFAGPVLRESPWGWWKLREEGPLLVAPDDLEGARRALTALRAAARSPGAWATDIATPADHSILSGLRRRSGERHR